MYCTVIFFSLTHIQEHTLNLYLFQTKPTLTAKNTNKLQHRPLKTLNCVLLVQREVSDDLPTINAPIRLINICESDFVCKYFVKCARAESAATFDCFSSLVLLSLMKTDGASENRLCS